MERKVWINLSNKNFTPLKVEEAKKASDSTNFKPRCGQWYSLPDDEYVSQWGNFINNGYSTSLRDKLIDNNGDTHIISAQLSDATVILKWKEIKDAYIAILKSNETFTTNDEKRKRLVQEIRSKFNNNNIQHIVLNLQNDDIDDIKETMWLNCYSEEDRKKISLGRNLSDLDGDLALYRGLSSDFETFKKEALMLTKMYIIFNESEDDISYEELKASMDEEELSILNSQINEIVKIRDLEFDYVVKRVLKYRKAEAEEYQPEILKLYREKLSESNNFEEIGNYIKKLLDKDSTETDITNFLVEYFSGYIDEKGELPYHDVPSLAVFDTDCLNIIDQKTQNIFSKTRDYQEEDFEL